MSWKTIHKEATVADLHTHPAIKATILASGASSSIISKVPPPSISLHSLVCSSL